MDFSFRQLRSIVAVAETRSFTGAARRLRLSQQSVSALVREVEARLGVQLFRRTTRSVEPTAECEALVPEINAALGLLDGAFSRLRSAKRGEPPLRIAITPALAYGELQALLEALEGHLSAEPDVREVWADELLAGLADGRFDAGLGIEVPPTQGLEIRPWRQQRLDLLVAASHPFAALPEIRVAQLAGMTLVAPGQRTNAGLRAKLATTLDRAGVRPILVDFSRVAGPAAASVERGLAATVWLSAMDERYLPAGLVHLPLREPETLVTTSLVMPHPARSGPVVALGALCEAIARTSTQNGH